MESKYNTIMQQVLTGKYGIPFKYWIRHPIRAYKEYKAYVAVYNAAAKQILKEIDNDVIKAILKEVAEKGEINKNGNIQ